MDTQTNTNGLGRLWNQLNRMAETNTKPAAPAHDKGDETMTGKFGVTTKLEIITPEIAAEYLATRAENQRGLSDRAVDLLAADMRRGNWQITHQGIAFDVGGRLVDGQHRLSAVVASGCTVPMTVTRGVASTAIHVMDRGRARTAAQVLHMLTNGKLTSSNQIAAALGWIARLRRENPDDIKTQYVGTVTDIIELYHEHAGVTESLRVVRSFDIRRLTGAESAFAALHYVFAGHDRDAANRFMERLGRGVGLTDGDPVFAFRRYLELLRDNSRKNTPTWVLVAMAIKAWNYERENRRIKLIVFKVNVESVQRIK